MCSHTVCMFIQYMARIWPWDSIESLHIRITIWYPYHLFFSFMVMLQTFKRKRHCSGCGVAMGCYGRSIVPGAAIVIPQCYGRYCSTPWQHEFTAITGCQSIDNFLDFNVFCCIFLLNNSINIIRRNCRVGTVFVLDNKCSGLRPSVTLSSR